MWVLFAALSAALLLTCIWQRIQYGKLQKEINYISNRLETLSITSENGFVLLPTDHACMKKLGATINTLLQNFYEKKSEYEQAQKAMAQVLTNISHDIIMVYTAISMAIGYICCSGYIVLVDRFFDMLEGTFQISMLQTWIPMAITTVVVCTVLSLWPFIIGMIRKSVPATIVTSLVVIVFRQLIISKNITYQESLLQILLVAFITFGVALFAFKKKVPELY